MPFGKGLTSAHLSAQWLRLCVRLRAVSERGSLMGLLDRRESRETRLSAEQLCLPRNTGTMDFTVRARRIRRPEE